ncbi:peptidylprolyl isomerase [uncultured Intestinimonas sp.]|uniref:peptidylprolyl isomerase n=1 Tax=uncultured Intestinimonas sp. TaxID=1689265 RepID=UPI0025DCC957|nr:peptidylprolyl isomerase [uncultured Intestinimonas sp.]
MKLTIRTCAAVLSGTVLAASLAGCSGSNAAAPETFPLPEGVPQDIIMETAGISASEPVLTVDGGEVPAEELLYWVSYTADQYAQYGMLDWTMDMGDGSTMADYILDTAVQNATLYQVVDDHAEARDAGWTEKNASEYQSQLDDMIWSLGVQAGLVSSDSAETTTDENGQTTYVIPEDVEPQVDAEFVRFLAYMGLSQEGFFHLNQTSFLYNNMLEQIQNDESITAETLDEAGVYHAKHILIQAEPVTDEEGNVTDDGMAAAQTRAQEIYDQLMSAEDPLALFDELMASESQDPGSQSQPDGYTFGPGEMVAEFEEGTAALAIDEIGAPVQSDYGYHIILRLDADNDEGRAKYLDVLVDQWMDEAQVEQSEALQSLDLQAFYEGLGELRTALNEQAAAAQETAPVETTEPAESSAPAESAPAESSEPAA